LQSKAKFIRQNENRILSEISEAQFPKEKLSRFSLEKREIYNLNRDDTVVAVVGAVDNVEKQNYQ
jgi:hypothetical protein